MREPTLIFTQGDPAGIGPEILLRLAAEPPRGCRRLFFVAEMQAFEALRGTLPPDSWEPLRRIDGVGCLDEVDLEPGSIGVLEPDPDAGADGRRRKILPGEPSEGDARATLAALDLGIELARSTKNSALITAPLNKAEIARYVDPAFRGHTDYLAEKCGLERYGRDYLMAFLSPRLRVALLSTHLPLRQALDLVTTQNLVEAGRCLARSVPGRSIVVAGLDPHAGEGGLLGTADDLEVRPAVEQLRAEGLDFHGPESADSLFARMERGAYDWVLALYHDQGLIALKTAAFGSATNWTAGLPFIRTSVDHGTAYDIAGRGVADAGSLRAVVEQTLELLR